MGLRLLFIFMSEWLIQSIQNIFISEQDTIAITICIFPSFGLFIDESDKSSTNYTYTSLKSHVDSISEQMQDLQLPTDSLILLVVEIGKQDEYSLNNTGIVTIKHIEIEWTNS